MLLGVKRLSGTDALFLSTETPAWHQHVGGLTVVDPAESERFSFDEVRRTLLERIDAGAEVPVEAEGGPAPPRPGGVDRGQGLRHRQALPAHRGAAAGWPARGRRPPRDADGLPARPAPAAVGDVVRRRRRRRPGGADHEVPPLPHGRHVRRRPRRAAASTSSPNPPPPAARRRPATTRPGSTSRPTSSCSRGRCSRRSRRRGSSLQYAGAHRGRGLTILQQRNRNPMAMGVAGPCFNGTVGPHRQSSFVVGEPRRRPGDEGRARREGQRRRPRPGVRRAAPAHAAPRRHAARARSPRRCRSRPASPTTPTRPTRSPPWARRWRPTSTIPSSGCGPSTPARSRPRSSPRPSGPARSSRSARWRRRCCSTWRRGPRGRRTSASGSPSWPTSWCRTSPARRSRSTRAAPGCRASTPPACCSFYAGLNITLLSYMDRLDFGLTSDPDLLEDPWEIADGIKDALAELMDAAEPRQADAGARPVRPLSERSERNLGERAPASRTAMGSRRCAPTGGAAPGQR